MDAQLARRRADASSHPIHGEAARGQVSPEYKAWLGIKSRCYAQNGKDYANWGGRGITVCERWKNSYLDFLDDMGRRPSTEYSIERIVNSLGYEPGNCRWATRIEQGRNKRNNVRLTAFSKTKLMVEWAEEAGIHYRTLYMRIKAGWTPERAVTQPLEICKTKGRQCKTTSN